MDGLSTDRREHREEHWISFSDLMTGLMMFFLFVAIAFMSHVNRQKEAIEDIAVTYDHLRVGLYNALYAEFQHDLIRWNASIDTGTLSIRFHEPEVFFARGQSDILPDGQRILSDFFPRYVRILTQDTFSASIEELRIEGHASSEWDAYASQDEAYFYNMDLAQERTRTVLRYVIALPGALSAHDWLIGHATANGLSSSRPILNADGQEDRARSRRVEFRVRTRAEERIEEILKRRGSRETS